MVGILALCSGFIHSTSNTSTNLKLHQQCRDLLFTKASFSSDTKKKLIFWEPKVIAKGWSGILHMWPIFTTFLSLTEIMPHIYHVYEHSYIQNKKINNISNLNQICLVTFDWGATHAKIRWSFYNRNLTLNLII